MAKPNVFGPVSSQARFATGHTSDGVMTHPVAANQTIHRGDALVWSSGLLAQALALPGSDGSGTETGSTSPIAFALADITTSATPDANVDKIPVMMLAAGSGRGLVTRIRGASAGASEQQDVNVGTLYVLGRWRLTSTRWFYYMTTTTAAGDIRLLKKSPESDKADDYGVVTIGL